MSSHGHNNPMSSSKKHNINFGSFGTAEDPLHGGPSAADEMAIEQNVVQPADEVQQDQMDTGDNGAQEAAEIQQDSATREMARPLPSTDEDMVDADARTIVVETTALSQEQRQLVLEDSKDLYPEGEYSDIFTLRGKDVPGIKPGQMKKTRKLQCNVALSSDGTNYQFVGASFEHGSKSAPTAATGNNKAKLSQEQKKAQAQLGKQKKAAEKQELFRDNVKVAFCLDSQTPNIEISTAVDATKAEFGKANIMVTRIWGDEIVRNEDGPAMWINKASASDFESAGEPGNAETKELKKLADDNRLLEISFQVRKPEKSRTWSGVLHPVLDAVRARSYQDSVKNKTFTRDLLVKHLDQGCFLSIYVVATAEETREWHQLFDYLKNLFRLVHIHGNYWVLKQQFHKATDKELEFKGYEAISFPFKPPRWLVKSWRFTVTERPGETTTFSDPVAHTWDCFAAYDELPDPDQAAFMIKLGIRGEENRQARDLAELVHSKDKLYFSGRFERMDTGLYLVRVKIDAESEIFDAHSIKLPSENTRVQLKIDPKNAYDPREGQMVQYSGTIVSSYVQDECDFACLVRGPSAPFTAQKDGLRLLKYDVYYPLFCGYPEDHTPFTRAIDAVSSIQAIDSAKKPEGVDLKAFFLGDDTRPPLPDAVPQMLASKPAYLQAANKFVEQLRPKPNEVQKAALVDTLETKTGLTIIQGPPGCGKSRVITDISKLHGGVLERKTIMAAPTNEGVINCVEAFLKSNKKSSVLSDDEWVHFTGAYFRMARADRLRTEEELIKKGFNAEDAKLQVDADNLVSQFRQMSISVGGATVMSEWSFGSKLREFIKRITQVGSTYHQDLRQAADQHVSLSRKLPTNHVEKERKAIRKDLDILESNLGVEYIKRVVRLVFVTLSSASHPMLAENFATDLIIIDEAAHESITGLMTACGPYKSTLKQIVLAGDHEQQQPMFIAKDSNLGHAYLSRAVFEAVADDPKQRYPVFRLDRCYRMPDSLLNFTSNFYNKKYGMELKAHENANNIDVELSNTLKAFWKQRMPDDWTPNALMLNIDVTGKEIRDELAKNTTTKQNTSEAEVCATLVKQILDFVPPESVKGKSYRKVEPTDIGICTPYKGQAAEIVRALKAKGIDTSKVKVSTTKKWQGHERNIMLFSAVVNTGSVRPVKGETVPIGFVANDKNINVSLSRARVARYIIGGLQCLVQMQLDKHEYASRYAKFFQHLREQASEYQTLTLEQFQEAMGEKEFGTESALSHRNLFVSRLTKMEGTAESDLARESYDLNPNNRPKPGTSGTSAYESSHGNQVPASINVNRGRGGGRGRGGRGGGRGGRGGHGGRGGRGAPY